MHFAHPLGVAAGKIIVDGDDMHALPRKRFEIGGKSRDERLAFARLHLGDAPLEEADAADDLHMEVTHAEDTSARLAEGSKGVVEDIVERLTVLQAALQDLGLALELAVRHRLVLGFEALDLVRHFIELFEAPAAVAVLHKTK